MMNPNLNKILKGKTSRYSLVTAVAKRAREISEDEDMAEKIGTTKPVTYALNELIDGKYTIIEPEEIRDI